MRSAESREAPKNLTYVLYKQDLSLKYTNWNCLHFFLRMRNSYFEKINYVLEVIVQDQGIVASSRTLSGFAPLGRRGAHTHFVIAKSPCNRPDSKQHGQRVHFPRFDMLIAIQLILITCWSPTNTISQCTIVSNLLFYFSLHQRLLIEILDGCYKKSIHNFINYSGRFQFSSLSILLTRFD